MVHKYKKYKCENSNHIWILLKYLENRRYAIFYNLNTDRYKILNKKKFSVSKVQRLFKMDSYYQTKKEMLLFPNGISVSMISRLKADIYHVIYYNDTYKYVGKCPHRGYGIFESDCLNSNEWRIIKNIKLLESL